jgi:hypothetical protein
LKILNFDIQPCGDKRKLQLHELDEMRLQAYESSRIYKERMKLYHDKKIVQKEFHVGQQVLLYNSRLRLFPGKLKSKWSGPFLVIEVRPHCAIKIEDPTTARSWLVNGQRLKHYLGGVVERLTTVLHLNDP